MEFSGTVMETGENVSAVKEVRTTQGCKDAGNSEEGRGKYLQLMQPLRGLLLDTA